MPLFMVYKIPSAPFGYNSAREHKNSCCVLVCTSILLLSCTLYTLTLEPEMFLQTDRPHLALSTLFYYPFVADEQNLRF